MSTLSAPTLVNPQDIFSTSSTIGTSLGAQATTGDGRIFRYALAGGTTLVPGTLLQASAEDTTNYQNLAAAATSIGGTQVVMTTSTTATANVLSNGLLVVTTSTGAGYSYGIASNSATSAVAGLTINLNDKIVVATTTGSRFDLIPNPYSGVVINPSTASSAPVGVAVYPITNAQYGWVLVAGQGAALADGTVTVGTTLVASNGTNGAVEPLAGVQAVVGIALTGIATTEYGNIAFNLL